MQNGWSEIRPVRPADLEAILAIEQVAMAAPWNAAMVQAEFDTTAGVGLVVENGDGLCGYAFFRVYPPECELLHLVVAPQQRRRGLGESLLRAALRRFAQESFTTCLLELRASNAAALNLYTKLGFLQVGRRKGYYRQPDEDALLMNCNLRIGDEVCHENTA